jgi:hypothetical protein
VDIDAITPEDLIALREWACGINRPEKYPKPLAESLRDRLEERGRMLADGVVRWVG